MKRKVMEQYWSEIITFLVTLGSSWGVINTKVKNQEKELEELKGEIEEMRKDHDLLIRVDTKVDTISDSIKELKNIIEKKGGKK